MQSGVVVIPKSVYKERMQQNFDLFDFTLTAEDMAKACSSRTTTQDGRVVHDHRLRQYRYTAKNEGLPQDKNCGRPLSLFL